VYRLLLRGLHGYSLLYAISRRMSSPRGDKNSQGRGGRRLWGDGAPQWSAAEQVPLGYDVPSARRCHSHRLTKIQQRGRLRLWSAGALQATAGGFGYTSGKEVEPCVLLFTLVLIQLPSL